MRGLLAELQRRKVFRAAIAYAAGAWAVLQVADLFFPMVGLPEWSMALVLLVSAAGFPIAMGLAWFFDFSSHGLIATTELPPRTERPPLSAWQAAQALLIAALVPTVGYLYYDRLFVPDSIAVMPFEDFSTDGKSRYFSDGVSEEILNALAQVDGLQVAARTSSFAFRGSKETAVEIGRKLGVAALLEGSVRIVDESVRVTAQLIDTSTGFHLWSENYDRKLEDIFALQDDVARRVLYKILPLITSAERFPTGPSTTELDAYNEYLKGKALLREPSTDSIIKATKEHFRTAIGLDPAYAEAWAGLCEALLADYRHNNRSNYQVLQKGKGACDHALELSSSGELDPSKSRAVSLDVYIAQGILYREEGDKSDDYGEYYSGSLDALLQAEELSPDSSRVLMELGATYSSLASRSTDTSNLDKAKRYLDKAELILLRATQADGARWDSFQTLANFYFDSGDFPQAIRFYEKAWEANPGATDALVNHGSALDWLGEKSQAEYKWLLAKEQAQATGNTGAVGFIDMSLGGLYYYQGEPDRALQAYETAARYRGDDHIIQGRIAESYRALGNRVEEHKAYEKAIRFGKRAHEDNPGNWETVGLLAIYHGFSGQPDRARDYLQKMLALEMRDKNTDYFAALAYWSIGDVDAALEAFDLAWQQNSMHYILANDPDLKQLRLADPDHNH